MTPRSRLGIALLVATAVLAACGGDSTAPRRPTTGLFRFNAVTTGKDIDNEFFVIVDGGSPFNTPSNSLDSLTLGPGPHTLAVSGLAFNCDVTAAPTTFDIVAGRTTAIDVRVGCTPFLSNAIVYIGDQSGNGEVMVMRPDGSRIEQLTSDDGTAYTSPSVSPDGQSIAVAAVEFGVPSSSIYLLDRFGKGRTKLVGNSTFDWWPTWSPDGTRIAFRSVLGGPYNDYGRIFVVNRDGTGLRQLTPDVAATDYQYDDSPSWSPDGTRLVFQRNAMLFFINADGTGLVSTGVVGESPSWSPDGTQIVFWNFINNGLFAMDMSFSARRLTNPAQVDASPRWSPDGLQVAFHRVEPGGFHLYKVRADGTGLARISSVAQNEYEPSWARIF